MKVLCFLIPFFLYIIDSIYPHHLNVGTVLFTKADLSRKCWSEQEKSLLTARQMMQGLLPDPDYMDITKAGTITVLVEYFQSCIEVIGQSTSGKTQHLMFLALSDALGGYLRSYVLPITRQAYYAGHVKYCEAIKIYQFYNDIKDFLKTDGCGWAAPRRFTLCCKIRPLKITTKGCEMACAQLYYKENSKQVPLNCEPDECSTQTPLNCPTPPLPVTTIEIPHPPPCFMKTCLEGDDVAKQKLTDFIEGVKNQKLNEGNREDYIETWLTPANNIAGHNVETIEKMRENAKLLKDRLHWSTSYPSLYERPLFNNENSSLVDMLKHLKKIHKREGPCPKKAACPRELSIPLPVLDDPENPQAIGIPFRRRPIRTLDSPHSVCILVRYYITVIKCLVTKGNNRCDVCNFNAQFQAWLTSYVGNVLPRLSDETWYPAFGGVLRISETINTIGLDDGFKCLPKCKNDIGFMFSKGIALDESDYLKSEECADEDPVPCNRSGDRTYLTLAIVTIVLMWIMAFCYCICCYCPSVKIEDEDPCMPECDKNKGSDYKNSFIVQCLVRFFKRAAAEEDKRDYNNLMSGKMDEGAYGDDSEIEIANRQLSPADATRASASNSPRRVSNRDNRDNRDSRDNRNNRNNRDRDRDRDRDNRRYSRQRETIVLPAQISPMHTELPLDLTSFWPLSDFRENADRLRQYPEECSKSPPHHFERKETPSRSPKKESEQFRTIWRRKRSVRSLDSCDDTPPRKAFAVCRDEGSKFVGRTKMKEKSSSNYTDDSHSEDDNRKRLIYVGRSRPGFSYPRSYPYSYDSTPNSYSTSQVDDHLRMDLYDHIVACHNSFAKKSRLKDRQISSSDSESERDMTTSNSSGSVLTPKRMP